MTVHHDDGHVQIHHGDCLDVLRQLPDNSIDSVVTDPPYSLQFMSKDWDRHESPKHFQDWCQQWATECLRVLKPGGWLLSFGGTRTWHRLACAIEDAGFEMRDSIAWLYGSGFPKSLDVSKAIDKVRDWSLVEGLSAEIKRARAAAGLSLAQIGQAMQWATGGQYGAWYHRGGHMFFETGRSLPSRAEWKWLQITLPIRAEFTHVYAAAEREVLEVRKVTDRRGDGTVVGLGHTGDASITAPATEAAQQWQGWGTALKPAFEPVVVARKPLGEATVAGNVLRYGTGALNIDATRIGTDTTRGDRYNGQPSRGSSEGYRLENRTEPWTAPAGRWPANVVLDENQAAALDQQSGDRPGAVINGSKTAEGLAGSDTFKIRERPQVPGYADQGGASRFFFTTERDFDCCDNGEHAAAADPLPIETLQERFLYTAKAPKSERPTYEREGDGLTTLHSGRGTIRKRCTLCGKQEVNVTAAAMCSCPEPQWQPDPAMEGRVSHPTVKPLALMRWLVKLVTPPGGTCLDPFAGSGATVEACMLEGFDVIGVEREAEYLPLIMQRVNRQYEARALVDLLPRPAPSLFDEDEGAV